MKEKLTKNLGLKILSVLFAFFVWLFVVNISNPEVSRTQEVPLEFLNEEVFTDAGETYDVNRHTVTVAYDVHTLDEGRIKASDFRATVDLSELYDVTGSVQITVEVLNNASLVRNVTPRPSVVHVTTEQIQTKEFSLTANITGRPMEDYSVNSIILEPEIITVTGPVSQVGLINSVGVEINVMRSGDDLSGVTEPIFYDANGNALTVASVNKVSVDPEEISYFVGIDRDRMIPLVFNITGSVPEGYRFAGYQATENEVRVSGADEVLSTIEQIIVSSPDLDIDGATTDRTVQIDIRQSLPSGSYLTDSNQAMVDVRLIVEELISREISLSESEITVNGMDEEFNYRIPNPAVTLTVRGAESELATLRVGDYGVVIDVSGLGEGSHSVQPQYTQDDPRFTVLSAEPVMIDIMRRNTGPGVPPEDRETPEPPREIVIETSPEDETEETPEEENTAQADETEETTEEVMIVRPTNVGSSDETTVDESEEEEE